MNAYGAGRGEGLSVLCLVSVFKGERFLRRLHERGAAVHVVTDEEQLEQPWPRGLLAGVYAQPSPYSLDDRIAFVSYLARSRRFDRIVALDEFDLEAAAALREHLRLPGLGTTATRAFRDKLVTRELCRRAGIPVPEFTALVNDDEVAEFVALVPPPWMCKPRSLAEALGISKVEGGEELWNLLAGLGDGRSHHLLEQFVPGDVYHIDSIVAGGEVRFSAVHLCGTPPFDVVRDGGVFTTATVERGSDVERRLKALNRRVVVALGLAVGATHAEFILGRDDGRLYLLECAARVGGAHIAEVVEAATGVNPWSAWADAELDGATFHPSSSRNDHAGLVVTLTGAERADLSAYDSPDVVYRLPERFTAGLVIAAPDHGRVETVLSSLAERFRRDFGAAPALA